MRAGYLFATGLILWSSLTDLNGSVLTDLGYVIEWQAVGIVFLEVARLVNDKLVLSAGPCALLFRTGSGHICNVWCYTTGRVREEGLSEAGFDNNVELVGFSSSGSCVHALTAPRAS